MVERIMADFNQQPNQERQGQSRRRENVNQQNQREQNRQHQQLREQEQVINQNQGREIQNQDIEEDIEEVLQNNQLENQERNQQENQRGRDRQERRENERFEDELKAAEILCYLNLKERRSLTQEELQNIVLKMKQEHSAEIIDQAIKIAKLRNQGLSLAEKIYQTSKRENKSSADYAKEESLREELNYQLKERNNFYYKEIILLKKLLLEEKYRKLQQEIDNNPALANLTPEEKAEDLKNKMKSYEVFLTKLVLAELEKDNEVKEKIETLKKQENFFYNLISKFSKLPRATKAIIGSVLVGGATAVFAPSMILTTLPLYFTYRAGRAVFGSTLAGVFQKFFGKIVERAYQKDYKTLGEEFSKLLLGERDVKTRILNSEDVEVLISQSQEIDDLIQQGDFARLANLNFEIALNQQERIRKLEKQRKVNYVASGLAMGLLGGYAGAQIFDYLFGPQFIVPTSSKTSSFEEIPPRRPTNLDLATIRKGEGIEHALKRQLLNDPVKFGWDQKTDLNSWANKTAHLIAIKNGYVNPITGEEVRVYDMSFKGQSNPAYLLEVENGQYKVIEYFQGQEVKSGVSQINPYEYKFNPKISEVNLEQTKVEAGIVNDKTEVLITSEKSGEVLNPLENQSIKNIENLVLEKENLILFNDVVYYFNKSFNLFDILKNVRIVEILNNLDSNYYKPEVKNVLNIFKEIPMTEFEKGLTFNNYIKYQILNKENSVFIKKILG